MTRLTVAVIVAVAASLPGCGETHTVTTTQTVTTTATPAATQPVPLTPASGPVSLSDGQGTVISWYGPDAGQLAADFQANSAREDNTYWTLYGSPLIDADDVCTMSAAASHRDNVAVGVSNSVDSQTANRACADFLSHGWTNSGPSAGQGPG